MFCEMCVPVRRESFTAITVCFGKRSDIFELLHLISYTLYILHFDTFLT
jgi:hypothetical protein